MTPRELFSIISKTWKWVAKDKNGYTYLYSKKPEIRSEDEWSYPDTTTKVRWIPDDMFILNFENDDWTKCIAGREEEEEVGV